MPTIRIAATTNADACLLSARRTRVQNSDTGRGPLALRRGAWRASGAKLKSSPVRGELTKLALSGPTLRHVPADRRGEVLPRIAGKCTEFPTAVRSDFGVQHRGLSTGAATFGRYSRP